VGVYLPIPFTSAPSIDLQREAAARLGRAGYPAVWTNETVGGKDPLVQYAFRRRPARPHDGRRAAGAARARRPPGAL